MVKADLQAWQTSLEISPPCLIQREGGAKGSDICAMGDQALCTRSGSRQLHDHRNFAFVAQNAELHGLVLVLVLRFPLGGEFLAQIADRANALAIDRSNDVAGFYARLFRCRTGIHFANQNALAIGSSKECAELAVEIFRI